MVSSAVETRANMRSRALLTLSLTLAVGLMPARPADARPVSALPATSRPADSLQALSGALERVSERVAPAVVQVHTTGFAVNADQQLAVLTRQEGIGSGVVIDADGYIVTNAHVVAGARRITVQLAPRSTSPTPGAETRTEGDRLEAELVGIDRPTDLALLRVPRMGLEALTLGDSDQLRQGQLVLAFGSPLGLGNTVTMGIVSAVARQLSLDDPAVYVQTDAPVNPGNSGGPLVDSSGQVVGINTMILSRSGGSEGVGLAIPANVVRVIAAQLKANGRVHRGMIGVQLQTVDSIMAAALRLPQSRGVIVTDVDRDGPAGPAGVQIGDVFVLLDGRPVESVRQFSANLFRHAADATVTLDLLRGDARLKLKVPVVSKPEDPSRYLAHVDPKKNLVPQLDLLCVDLDDELKASRPRPHIDGGVLVAAASSEAAVSDRFQPGDIIHGVNRSFLLTLADLKDAVADLKDGDPVVVQVERQGQLMLIAYEID
jgi:serine protease Do